MPVTRKEGWAGVVESSFEYAPTSPSVLYARTARKYATDGLGSRNSNAVTLPTSMVVVYRCDVVPYDNW